MKKDIAIMVNYADTSDEFNMEQLALIKGVVEKWVEEEKDQMGILDYSFEYWVGSKYTYDYNDYMIDNPSIVCISIQVPNNEIAERFRKELILFIEENKDREEIDKLGIFQATDGSINSVREAVVFM